MSYLAYNTKHVPTGPTGKALRAWHGADDLCGYGANLVLAQYGGSRLSWRDRFANSGPFGWRRT